MSAVENVTSQPPPMERTQHPHFHQQQQNPRATPIAPAVRPAQPTMPRPPESPADATLRQRTQPRARKSRYSNFLPEVDSAISIIYRELESTADLRSQLVDTQTELRTLSQELRIRDNQLLLANKMSANKQALEAEVNRLRGELESRGSSNGEVEFLREGMKRLEREVEELKEELRRKEVEGAEWRERLRRLIEPGAS
jgi:chromosome segregation ATPase